ncbi:MAG: cytochrome c, partial [Acidimicrobiales bacterium]
GQRLSQSFGVMPAFGSSLSAEEINAVVRYEREILSGEAGTGATAGAPASGGHGPVGRSLRRPTTAGAALPGSVEG